MEEILKLARLLMEVGAEFTLAPTLFGDGYQVILYRKGEKIDDAVWATYSHGYKSGLLETYRLSGCDGYETAQEVFDGWEKMMLDLTD